MFIALSGFGFFSRWHIGGFSFPYILRSISEGNYFLLPFVGQFGSWLSGWHVVFSQHLSEAHFLSSGV